MVDCPQPHGGLRPFNQKLTCLTQLTSGPCVVKIWSRNPRISEATKPANSTVWSFTLCGETESGLSTLGSQNRLRPSLELKGVEGFVTRTKFVSPKRLRQISHTNLFNWLKWQRKITTRICDITSEDRFVQKISVPKYFNLNNDP